MKPIDSELARKVATSIAGEWRAKAHGPYANGFAAARAGATMSAAPMAYTAPDWPLWREGFIEGATLPESSATLTGPRNE